MTPNCCATAERLPPWRSIACSIIARSISSKVVNAAGDLVGFVSDGDVASYLGKTEIALVDSTLLNGYRYIDDEDAATRLRELMGLNVMAVATRRVISVEATTPVDEVCALFASKRIKKVPVVQDGKLVGALSRRNIMRSLVEAIDILEK